MSRYDYVAYDKQAQEAQALLKSKFQELSAMVEALPPGRATSLVQTKLEEAYMWCGKAIRDDQVRRETAAQISTELQEGRNNS